MDRGVHQLTWQRGTEIILYEEQKKKWGKEKSFQKIVIGQLGIYMEIMKLDSYLIAHTKQTKIRSNT